MDISSYNQRITVKLPTTTQAANGETVVTYADPDKTFGLFAKVEGMKDEEKVENSVNVKTAAWKIETRYMPNFDSGAIIIWRGRTLHVSSVVPGGLNLTEKLDWVAVESNT